MAYRKTLSKLENVLDCTFDTVHVVGGGGQNDLLNQLTADALDRAVVVGPYEATSLGNGLVQAMALGECHDLADLRRLVANSTSPKRFHPQNQAAWNNLAAP